MTDNLSGGWDAVADTFITARSGIGADVVRRWSCHLRPGGTVVDVGCGSGDPITRTLIGEGFEVFGIDASPALVSAFRSRFPAAQVVCEAAETSRFFGQTFDGVVAVGLMFLLAEHDQREVIRRVGRALNPGGRFLFSAPRHACEWQDTLTGRPSLSLGLDNYEYLLIKAGMCLIARYFDEVKNHYFDAIGA